jgi:iron complex outermembrane receptor protein
MHWSVVWLVAVLWSGVSVAQSVSGSKPPGETLFVLPEVTVVAPTPMRGDEINREKIPAMVQTLTAEDFARDPSFATPDTLGQRIPGTALTDVQGNPFSEDLRYRGFAASPLQGTPQGLAVYQNGIRINEAFGDTVNWDLVPEVAIDQADIWTNNPIFGLNALGGAVSLRMKNGFSWQGFEGEAQGGFYGRYGGSLQYGGQKGHLSYYLAADALHDDGWRDQSPSSLLRFYGDLGWQDEPYEFHLTGSAASNDIGVVGPTPIEMVRQNDKSIYTWPQTTHNEMGLLALTGKYSLPNHWSLQSNLYLRAFNQKHVDGNDVEFAQCSDSSGDPSALCLSSEEFVFPSEPPPAWWEKQFIMYGPDSRPIPFTSADVPYGTVDRTWTEARTFGSVLEATTTAQLLNRDNYFVMGASIDLSSVKFHSNSRLGYIYPNLFIGPNADVAGTGTVIHNTPDPTAPPEFTVLFEPAKLRAHNTYYGLYAADTIDFLPQLSLTFGARYNVAGIETKDRSGSSPKLNGGHTFSRVNPLVGLTYRITPTVSAYIGYSEANRVPTPLELNCADPNRPCLLENSLVSDPPLKQVVAHSYEFGLRGWHRAGDGRVTWRAGGFRTDSDDDIISLASVVPGRGYFTNVPSTRRQGIEASLQYQSRWWLAYVNYSYIDATSRFNGELASPNNPAADNGNILVSSGDRIPGIPQHQLKMGLDFALTPAWKIGCDVIGVGSQYYVGDEANQNSQLPEYWVANLHFSYQLTEHFQIFGLLNNMFDRKYATYGTYFQTDGIQFKDFQDPRTITPAQPISAYGGVRLMW